MGLINGYAFFLKLPCQFVQNKKVIRYVCFISSLFFSKTHNLKFSDGG